MHLQALLCALIQCGALPLPRPLDAFSPNTHSTFNPPSPADPPSPARRAAGAAIGPYGGDCVPMLEVGAEDPCPEVVLEACAGLRALVAALGRRLGPAAKALGWTFIPQLTHKCAPRTPPPPSLSAAARRCCCSPRHHRRRRRHRTVCSHSLTPKFSAGGPPPRKPLSPPRRSKVRVAAAEALTPLLLAGAHECILDLTGFRSPNVIPIKAFYGDDLKARRSAGRRARLRAQRRCRGRGRSDGTPVTGGPESPSDAPPRALRGPHHASPHPQVNYFGKLATDSVPAVRAAFLAMVGALMTQLDERNEHEGRLLPFVLSALSDEAASIQEAAMGAPAGPRPLSHHSLPSPSSSFPPAFPTCPAHV